MSQKGGRRLGRRRHRRRRLPLRLQRQRGRLQGRCGRWTASAASDFHWAFVLLRLVRRAAPASEWMPASAAEVQWSASSPQRGYGVV